MSPAADFIATSLDMTRRQDDFSKEEFAKQLELAARILAVALDHVADLQSASQWCCFNAAKCRRWSERND